MKRFLSLWLPVVACMGVIFWLSSIPGLRITKGPMDFILRKGAHMGEYGLLTLLLARALQGTSPSSPEQTHLRIAIITALLYAVSDEIHQAFVPNRGPSAVDVLIDAVGVSVVALLWSRRPGFLRLKK